MAVLPYPTNTNLQTAQAGNADSTNTLQRPYEAYRQPILRITTNAGTTVTLNILGSVDGTTFVNLWYSVLSVAPNGYTKAAIVTTTAKTELYAIMPGQAWSFLKINQSVNTGMTPTSDLL